MTQESWRKDDSQRTKGRAVLLQWRASRHFLKSLSKLSLHYSSMQTFILKKKSWKAYFVPDLLNIFLNLLSILSKSELSIDWGFFAAPNQRIIRRAQEICYWISFHLGSHYPVLHAFVHIIAPCLLFCSRKSNSLACSHVLLYILIKDVMDHGAERKRKEKNRYLNVMTT